MIYFKIRTEFTEVKFGRVKNQWRGKCYGETLNILRND
jgi:hypothetical protein